MKNSLGNITKRIRWVIGIDEVGRGALAGPVTVAVVALPRDLRLKTKDLKHELGELRDSKKLSPKQREAWLSHFKASPHIEYAVARVYPRAIERTNISAAANLAALRAYQKLITHNSSLITNGKVFLDGGLYLGNPRSLRQSAFSQRMSARTVVRGDEKINAVSVASIIAKVHRDRAMARLAKQYPQYGFAIHKGYGTKMHASALKKYGPSRAHRKTFDPVARMS